LCFRGDDDHVTSVRNQEVLLTVVLPLDQIAKGSVVREYIKPLTAARSASPTSTDDELIFDVHFHALNLRLAVGPAPSSP
jgi:hypothetical protein